MALKTAGQNTGSTPEGLRAQGSARIPEHAVQRRHMQEQDAKRPGRGRSRSYTSRQRERGRIGQVLPADPSLPQGPTRARVSPPPHTAIRDHANPLPVGDKPHPNPGGRRKHPRGTAGQRRPRAEKELGPPGAPSGLHGHSVTLRLRVHGWLQAQGSGFPGSSSHRRGDGAGPGGIAENRELGLALHGCVSCCVGAV